MTFPKVFSIAIEGNCEENNILMATSQEKKAVFLDRDGTIIVDMVYLNDPDKIKPYPEAYEAITRLNQAGFMIILATNQSGVARGLVQEENVKLINQLIITDFKTRGAVIHDAFYCPHPVDGGCSCRKPNAGMLIQAAEKHSIDLKASWMVGDRMTDVFCGQRAGTRSILIQNEHTVPPEPQWGTPPHVVKNVLEACDLILKSSERV